MEEVSATSAANSEQNRTLRRRLEQTSSELEHALSKAAELSEQITTQQENSRSELSSQIRLAELWERSCRETQERNRDLENQLEREQEKLAEDLAQWQARAQAEGARALHAEQRIEELEREVERLEATVETNAAVVLHSPTGPNGHGIRGGPSTPSNRAQFSPTSSTGMFSPSAREIEKRGRSGMTLTQLYSELHAAKQAETLQRRRADKLQEEYEQYREEAERWAPEYQNVIQEFEQQKEDLAMMSINLQNAISEKEEAERQSRLMRNSIMDKERETRLYQQRKSGAPIALIFRVKGSWTTGAASPPGIARTRGWFERRVDGPGKTSHARDERSVRSRPGFYGYRQDYLPETHHLPQHRPITAAERESVTCNPRVRPENGTRREGVPIEDGKSRKRSP